MSHLSPWCSKRQTLISALQGLCLLLITVIMALVSGSLKTKGLLGSQYPIWRMYRRGTIFTVCFMFNRGTFLNGELAPSSRSCPFLDVLGFLITATHMFPCSSNRRRRFIHSNTRGSYSSLRWNSCITSPQS